MRVRIIWIYDGNFDYFGGGGSGMWVGGGSGDVVEFDDEFFGVCLWMLRKFIVVFSYVWWW